MRLPKGLDPGFFKDGTGEFSMMRLVVYYGVQLARIIVAVGLIVAPLELFVFKTKTEVGVTIVGIGTAMFGAGEVAKAWQAKSENSGGK